MPIWVVVANSRHKISRLPLYLVCAGFANSRGLRDYAGQGKPTYPITQAGRLILRTLALLRSLHSAHHSMEDAQAKVQRACDYRWLRAQFPGGTVLRRDSRLPDGTPAVAIVLPFTATPALRRGGKWPYDAEERENCHVEGAGACRAAGAPSYRRLESLSQGVANGAMSVLKDAARFDYLIEHQALRLTWRRADHLPGPIARRLSHRPERGADSAGRHGVFLLEVKIPGDGPQAALSGDWLDKRLDLYRRLLPASSQR